MKKKSEKKEYSKKFKKFFDVKFVAVNAVLLAFILYSFVMFVNQQSQISSKTEQLEELNQRIVVQDAENEEIKNVYDILKNLENGTQIDKNSEGLNYIEKIAREEYNYAKRDERIFINIAGD